MLPTSYYAVLLSNTLIMKRVVFFSILLISSLAYSQGKKKKADCTGKDAVSSGFNYTNRDCSIFSFTWTGTDSNAVKNFRWNFGDGTTSSKSSPEHMFSNGVFKVKLIVTGRMGCADTSIREITVNKPKADFYYSQQQDVPGKVVFLTKNVKLSYSWNFGDGIKVQNEVNPAHTYKESGIYSVELLVQNDAGCIDVIYKPISISLAPIPVKPLSSVNLEKRSNDLVKEIFAEHDSVKVTLYDNGEIDGDSITLIYNDVVLASRQMLTASPLTFTIKIDRTRASNQLIMYADNLGSIPPNTALMIINDGDKRYELNVSSTTTTNAAVSFKPRRL